MGISSVPAGLIIAGCAGVVIGGVTVVLCIYLGLKRLALYRSRYQKPWQQCIELQESHQAHALSPNSSMDGDIEKYGELYVPPNRRPVHIGLDIVNRMLLITGLPAHTVRLDAISAMEQGRAPRLSLNLPRPAPMESSEQIEHTEPVGEVTTLSRSKSGSQKPENTQAMSHVQAQPDVFVIGDGEDDENDVGTVTPSAHPDFGRGKSMAQLYLQPNTL
ncbi:hypothetical protein NX059_002841 [Plenodomus lindquistii]|nr:hypothetical protein NX059_002841 [Plenodomus lindquistii]